MICPLEAARGVGIFVGEQAEREDTHASLSAACQHSFFAGPLCEELGVRALASRETGPEIAVFPIKLSQSYSCGAVGLAHWLYSREELLEKKRYSWGYIARQSSAQRSYSSDSRCN